MKVTHPLSVALVNGERHKYFYFILLASPTGRDTATACANYCGPGTRSQFCGGRKPECPEETLEVRLRLTETQSTYNTVVEVEGVIDVHYASLTSPYKRIINTVGGNCTFKVNGDKPFILVLKGNQSGCKPLTLENE